MLEKISISGIGLKPSNSNLNWSAHSDSKQSKCFFSKYVVCIYIIYDILTFALCTSYLCSSDTMTIVSASAPEQGATWYRRRDQSVLYSNWDNHQTITGTDPSYFFLIWKISNKCSKCGFSFPICKLFDDSHKYKEVKEDLATFQIEMIMRINPSSQKEEHNVA